MATSRHRPKVLLLDKNGQLEPWWRYLLLSVMAFPESSQDRHAFMETVRRAKKANRELDKGPKAVAGLSDGSLVGGHLLWMLQESLHEGRTTLGGTLPFIRAALLMNRGFDDLGGFPKPEALLGELRKRVNRGESGGVHRRTILNRFRRYRTVAHLWGAWNLGHPPDPNLPNPYPSDRNLDLMPVSPERLGRLVAVAEALAEAAYNVPMPKLSGQRLMERATTWRVRIPANLREAGELSIPPVSGTARDFVRG